MKKFVLLTMVCICLCIVVGCNSSQTLENSDLVVANDEAMRQMEVTTAVGETATLSEEDTKAILEILENGEWYGEPTECASDCYLTIGDDKLSYHSECGTFNGSFTGENVSHRGSLVTDDETQQYVNGILANYVELGKY